MLYKVILTFESVYGMNAIEQYFPAVLLTTGILCKVVQMSEYVDKILKCDLSEQ